jgi:hypothetical protein
VNGPSVWVVRAGEGGVYADDFEESGVVAIGWTEVGPIAASDGDADIDGKFDSTYPKRKEGSRRNGAAQVRRFLREIKVGDTVATYSPTGRLYLLGKITGDVTWREQEPPRARSVTWTRQVSRDVLSEALRNTLGSALTLFRLDPETAAELFEKAVPYMKRVVGAMGGEGGRTAIPDFQTLMRPVLQFAGDGKEHAHGEALEHLGQEFKLSQADRQELLPSGKQSRFENRVGWAVSYLKKWGLISRAGVSRFIISDRGREILKALPARLDVAFLKARFPEAGFQDSAGDGDQSPAVFDEDRGAWQLRDEVTQRVRQNIERLVRDERVRRGALELLAFAIENADEERTGGWYVLERAGGLGLMTGRQLACGFSRSKMRVSIIGPIADEVRAALGADRDDDEEFKKIPGSIILTFPIEHAPKALELLKDKINAFVDATMARVRRVVSLDYHLPEAITYIASAVGRELPQPQPEQEGVDDEDRDDADPEEDDSEARKPKLRGRTPMFSRGDRSIAVLVEQIHRQELALPDLQRPFVWDITKVRDLLDSLFLGFPVGTLVLWHTASEREARAIGADRPGLRATTLIIDGQQRLTSLYAVMRGEEVVDKDGQRRRITIAFRPRDGRFEVSDAVIRNDPEFIPSVTELWRGGRLKSQIRNDLLRRLEDSGQPIDDDYRNAVEHNLDVAHAISQYEFPTVEIRKPSGGPGDEAMEVDVAEIFVRINNQGTRLKHADFVLTLLAVFQPQLRESIEARAREMSEGAIVEVDSQQLLRIACGVAFGRARMSEVYGFLQGVDRKSRESDPASRKDRLDRLEQAARQCTEKTLWRDFLLRVIRAGFVSPALIGSQNAIISGYTFYVRGRAIGIPKQALEEAISRWVFGTILTGRYSGSSETVFDEDLKRVDRLTEGDADAFLKALDTALGETLTGDYWSHTLLSKLDTPKSRAPSALAFRAAQVVLGARALFTDQPLQNLLNSNVQAGRAASEGHHLFPKAWLQSRGFRDRRLINQVANLADTGWFENSTINAQSPERYVARLREERDITDDAWGRLCAEHALPIGWEKMEYVDFLRERRRRMAEIIRVAYATLGGAEVAESPPPPWFLPGSDVVWQRIAVTERALRSIVRDVYVECFGEKAAKQIEDNVPENDRATLARALRARPSAADPMTIVDYLYLAQLPPLLFSKDVWQRARERFGAGDDLKQRLQTAITQITPVRNEIAHVREVAKERLQRADLACGDILRMLGQPT